MSHLRRPTQADLNQMSHAEKDGLILRLFDVLEGLERGVVKVEQLID